MNLLDAPREVDLRVPVNTLVNLAHAGARLQYSYIVSVCLSVRLLPL